ncbi:MAG: hypothetical protein ABR879_02080 [Methanomassiliicoccales archaeon]|jgi:hypothetical protein
MTETLKVTILSFACCNPKLAVHDELYIDRIRDAEKQLGIEIKIDMVHATEAMMTPDRYAWMKDVTPLFMKYGAAIAPALFVDEKLELYGGVPTLEKLVETLRKHLGSQA